MEGRTRPQYIHARTQARMHARTNQGAVELEDSGYVAAAVAVVGRRPYRDQVLERQRGAEREREREREGEGREEEREKLREESVREERAEI